MPLFGPPNVPRLAAKRDADGLIKALRYRNDTAIQVASARALGELGDPRAVEPLIQALAAGTSRAADALSQIGTPAVAPLIAALGGQTRAGRLAAAGALDRLGWKPDSGETGAAYWAAKEQWSRCAQIGEPAVAPLVRVLRDVPPGVVAAFRRIGSPAVGPLIAALADPAESTRERAATALGDIGDPRAVAPLIAALDVPGRRESARKAAARALGKLRDARAVDPLITALQDTGLPRVSTAAAEALGKIGDPRAVGPLLAAYHDMRAPTLGALVEIGAPAIEPLATALHSSQEASRRCAVLALHDIGGPSAVEPLITALHDESAPVRQAAAVALGKAGGTRVMEPLIAALHDDDDEVRGTAAEILEAWDTETVEAGLRPKHFWGQGDLITTARGQLVFPCSKCGALVMIPVGLAFKSLTHTVCGEPLTVPPVPCAEPSCHGVYQKCGGDVSAGETSVGSYYSSTEYRCEACGYLHGTAESDLDHNYSYRGPERCGVIRCSRCHRPAGF